MWLPKGVACQTTVPKGTGMPQKLQHVSVHPTAVVQVTKFVVDVGQSYDY